MTNRIWLSTYSLDDLNGGVEVLASKYCKILGLKQLSARRVGVNPQNIPRWEVSERMEKGLRDMNFELVLYDSVNCWSKRLDTKQSICICHENFKREAEAVDDSNFRRIKLLQWEYQKKSIDNADKIITISKLEHDNLKEDADIDSDILECSIDTEMFHPLDKEHCREHLKIPSDKKVFMYVGRSHIRKGIDIVEEMIKRFPEHLFINIVDVPMGLRRIYGNVGELNKISDEDLNICYNASDYLIMPSRYESFGMIYAEALATNLPIISTNVGIIPDIPKEYVQVSECVTSDSFEKAILKSLERPFSKGRELALERFSYKTMDKKLKEIVGQ